MLAFIAGVSLIAVTSYGQEAYGWGFFPLGPIGGAMIGLSVFLWRGYGRAK